MLEKAGIECSACPRVPGMQSSISAIAIEPGGERAIVNYRDDRMNTVKPGDPAAIVAQADAVLADNRFPDFVLPVCVAARERGIPVVLDADEPRHDSNRLLDVVSHVVFSAEGLRATAGVEDLAEGLKAVATMTPAWLGVTDGTKGVVWLDSGAVQRRDSFQVKTVDTLGAGDTFHGAFALMLAEGKSEREAIRFSAAAAAVKCTRFGGITGAPTRAEVEEFLKQHD
jgi:sugar/nucleoside kinase (ribokinase family)